MNTTSTKTVRDLAVEIPGATRIFERLNIDYCCGGNQTLDKACDTAGVAVENVINLLEADTGAHRQSEEPNFLTATMAELIDHIVNKHHEFTRSEIARLRELTNKVYEAHGQNHPELDGVRRVFQTLSDELEPHMAKEERVLFPYTIQLESESARGKRSLPRPPFGTVANPVRMMMMEHENAGLLLKQMRALTSDYKVPADGCVSYQTLYRALEAFESDLHQHIHLENNILFPRAVEMEGTMSAE